MRTVVAFFNQSRLYYYFLTIGLPLVLVVAHGLNYPVAFGILVALTRD